MFEKCLLKRDFERKKILIYKLSSLEKNARGKVEKEKGCVLHVNVNKCVEMLNARPRQKPARIIDADWIIDSGYTVQELKFS